jgi:hypothetical protein
MQTPASVIRPMVNHAYRGYFPLSWKQESMIPKPLMHNALITGSFRYIWQLGPNGPGR